MVGATNFTGIIIQIQDLLVTDSIFLRCLQSIKESSNAKAFEQSYSDYSDAYNKLLKANNDKDRFGQIDRMSNIQPGLISAIQSVC